MFKRDVLRGQEGLNKFTTKVSSSGKASRLCTDKDSTIKLGINTLKAHFISVTNCEEWNFQSQTLTIVGHDVSPSTSQLLGEGIWTNANFKQIVKLLVLDPELDTILHTDTIEIRWVYFEGKKS